MKNQYKLSHVALTIAFISGLSACLVVHDDETLGEEVDATEQALQPDHRKADSDCRYQGDGCIVDPPGTGGSDVTGSSTSTASSGGFGGGGSSTSTASSGAGGYGDDNGDSGLDNGMRGEWVTKIDWDGR